MENININILGKANDKIAKQIDKEYKYCEKQLKPKIDEWLDRLKVYSNQRRQKTAVGDPLLFTVFQTIFASLYDDKLMIHFEPREAGDIDTADNLNQLSDYDYQKMEKDILDYDWIWDTLFFGRGFVFMGEFDRKRKIPIPEVTSPFSILRDPKATSVNGNLKGFGGARFMGREVAQTMWQLEKHGDYFNLDKIKRQKEGEENMIVKAERARQEAQGREVSRQTEEELDNNGYYNLLEWFTFIDGERYLVTLGNERKEVVRYRKLQDQEKWPVIDRAIFPISHDWDGVSIPDLVEDKQRARAKLINAGLDIATGNANPMTLYDQNKIARRDSLDFKFNKNIPVDGDPRNAVVPMQKDRVGQEVQWILDLIDQGTQRALATPEIQQGQLSGKNRTLGELELVSAKVDTRYSLSAKIFGWSERRFWEKWYWLYKNHFKDGIDEKVIRLAGLWGGEFRALTRENIITKIDPDIKIESRQVTDSKKVTQRELLRGFISMAVGMPEFPIRYAMKELAELSSFRKDQIKLLFPPTYEEIKAEEENEMMKKNEMPMVSVMDDHMVHMLYHAKLNDTDIRKKHIEFHKQAMKIRKENEQMFREQGYGVQSQLPQGETPKANVRDDLQTKRSRREQSIPSAYKQ